MKTFLPQLGRDLAALYRRTLLDDVIPFWLKHGLDRKHGGIITALDRDGSVIDTDKSVWFQGRSAWMFATLYSTVDRRKRWLDAARSCVEFMRAHCFAPDGKMYFTVTREGAPLRMRRYVFSDCFGAIGFAAYARAADDAHAADQAMRCFSTFLEFTRAPGRIAPKSEPATRPMKALSPLMMTIATAQELRELLGDVAVYGATCTDWIAEAIAEIKRDFVKPKLKAVMECVGPRGEVIDHFDGRLLNPGHAIEAAWFILHEAAVQDDPAMKTLGLSMLDWMWERGWDKEYGGLYYYRDVKGLPIQDYWHDMKFWWPHNEAIIATLLAHIMTGNAKYAAWHRKVHDWSFAHFPDKKHGEWYGYLHRDGSVSVPLKGNMWKGPFHLPRMLWYCGQLLDHAAP